MLTVPISKEVEKTVFLLRKNQVYRIYRKKMNQILWKKDESDLFYVKCDAVLACMAIDTSAVNSLSPLNYIFVHKS